MKNKYPFPECNTCHLLPIGACTVSADLLSCSNPEVNKKEFIMEGVIKVTSSEVVSVTFYV